MKKITALFLLLSLIAPVQALEVADVKLADKVRVEENELVLNGAVIRTNIFLKSYIVVLYLGEKTSSGEVVLADAGAKRVALHMLRDMEAQRFVGIFEKAVTANHSPIEMAALAERVRKFSRLLLDESPLSGGMIWGKGDVIDFDYLPAVGTRVSVNGVEKGRVEGVEFYRAMLKAWLGDKPLNEDVKKGLLDAAQ